MQRNLIYSKSAGKPESIQFATLKPETADGFEVASITTDALIKKTGQAFTWCEEVIWDHSMQPKHPLNLLGDLIGGEKLEAMMNATKESRQKLAICYINKIINYGVIATDEITKGSVVSFYAGEYIPNLSNIDNKLEETKDSVYNISVYNKNDKVSGIISAGKYRNIAGFIQHAPTKQADKYEFEKSVDIDKVAYSNLTFHVTYQADQFPLYFLVASEDIKKGYILAYDYNQDYFFDTKIVPHLCYKNGALIDPNYYRPKKTHVRINTDVTFVFVDIETEFLNNSFKNYKKFSINLNNGNKYFIEQKDFEANRISNHANLSFVFFKKPSQIVFGEKHQKLMKEINQYLSDNKLETICQPLIESMQNGCYSQALRRACSFKQKTHAVKLAEILLNYRENFSFFVEHEVNEVSAFSIAKKNRNQALVALLEPMTKRKNKGFAFKF